jgi:hypothetical protein
LGEDRIEPVTDIHSDSSPQNYSGSKVQIDLDVAAGETIQVTIEMLTPEEPWPATPVETAFQRSTQIGFSFLKTSIANLIARISHFKPGGDSKITSLEEILFGLAILVYLSTRLIGLTQFPIYFFTDEAIQTIQAQDFINNGFKNGDQDLFPTYFVNGNQYNLSLSVYIQVIPYLIFGKSEGVTRGTAVFSTLIAAICIGLILRNIFKVKHWWAGTLLLSIAPAWFLHSRTAFETALMVSMYTGFLYFYLRYRYIHPKNLYLAMMFGALTFYAYSPGQVVIVVTGLLLLFSDLRYHWQNRKTGLIGLGILLVLVLPYLRFLITHGDENFNHLQILDSFLTEPISPVEKLKIYFSNYLQGLNPLYWFLPNENDLSRHLMKGYGHLLWISFPFAVLGLAICIKNIRSSMHRLILIALLAAPTGAALVGIGITRVLVFVIPATLLIALGLIACLNWVERRGISKKAITYGLFIPLVVFNFYMLNDALVRGPVWFNDYGLGGMQWGAQQIFSAVVEYQKEFPQTHILLSPSWANGTDVIARFFLPDSLPVELGSIEGYLYEHKPLDENILFVMIPEEYNQMIDSGKFTDIRIEKILDYPDGSPGFYFIRLHYVENIDEIMEAEKEERSVLQVENVTINGRQVKVGYSMLDMGIIQNVFDGDLSTLVRSFEANPLVIELTFPEVQSMQSAAVRVGGVATRVNLQLKVEGSNDLISFQANAPQTQLPKDVTIDFGANLQVSFIHIEVLSVNDGSPSHIHVWEVTFK